jgi:predicted molibdopterin-dependent oxidoreductase YjgC
MDGQPVHVPAGTTLLAACRRLGIETPTLCYLKNLTPVNVCRVCVVEVEGSRALVPACSRRAEEGMVVWTDTPRVRHSRRLVLELLASAVDLSLAPEARAASERYGARPERFQAIQPDGQPTATVAQPVKQDNDLFVRDYGRCILCYKCVEACGRDAQNTFAISVAGRGFGAHIATEFDVSLPESACVFCGNCIGVCPTGALMPTSEYSLRAAGKWDPAAQTQTETICPYCGVGCALILHIQDNTIVKATSPLENAITAGHLCIKGRFGWQFVQNR